MKHFVPTAETLLGVTLLQPLTHEDRERFADRCRGAVFPAGAEIVAYHDRDDDVYFIVSGKVRATMCSVNGKEVTFRDLDPGALFGHISAIDGKPRSAHVEAIEESRVVWTPARDFWELMHAHREVTAAVLEGLTGLVRHLTERVVEFSTLGVTNRIHAELLRMAGVDAATRVDGVVAEVQKLPTSQEIASRISTHREAVSRELTHLERLGVIEREGHTLRILDLPRLVKMVTEVKGEFG